MRAYFFVNPYLAEIQKGIQTAHCTAELFIREHNETGNSYLLDWATNHKTMIICRVPHEPAVTELRNLISLFDHDDNPYPWAKFNESETALGGIVTCVGIVLPEKIYETAKRLNDSQSLNDPRIMNLNQIIANMVEQTFNQPASPFECDVINTIRKYPLA